MPMTPTVPEYLLPTPSYVNVEIITEFDQRDLEGIEVHHLSVRTITLPCGAVQVVTDSENHLLVRPGSYLIENRWLGKALGRHGPVHLVCKGIDEAIACREDVRDDYRFVKIPQLHESTRVCELLVLDAYRAATNHDLIRVMDERAHNHLITTPVTIDNVLQDAFGFLLRGSDVFDINEQFNPRHCPLQFFAAMRRIESVLARVRGIDICMEEQIFSMSSRLDAILRHYADLKRIVDSPQWSERSLGTTRDRKATAAIAKDLTENAEIVDLIVDRPFRHSAAHIARDMRLAAAALIADNILVARYHLGRVSRVTEAILETFVPIMALRRELTPIVRFDLPTNAGDRHLLATATKATAQLFFRRDYDEGLEGAKFATQAVRRLTEAERHIGNGDFATALTRTKEATEGY